MFKETKLRWFNYDHLPEKMQPTSRIFAELASIMIAMCPTPSDQRAIALQKVIEAKDAFVRACIIHAEAVKAEGSSES